MKEELKDYSLLELMQLRVLVVQRFDEVSAMLQSLDKDAISYEDTEETLMKWSEALASIRNEVNSRI